MKKLGLLLLSSIVVIGLYGCDDKGMTIGSGGECRTSRDCPHPTLYKCEVKLGMCVEVNPAHCFNYTKDDDESDEDCGGRACEACADGRMCKANSDCISNLCEENICISVACDSDEKCKDSGGHSCNMNTHTCNTCKDGIMNGLETSRDCGGPDCEKCNAGLGCSAHSDCLSGACNSNHVCEESVCQDDESCPDSYVCNSGVCISCTDTSKNGTETDVDCGGSNCPACQDGKACIANTDCISNNCDGGTCRQKPIDTCTNGTQDNGETDVDCGGPCAQCAVGQKCSVPKDCRSWTCQDNTCQGQDCETVISNEVLINEVFTNPDPASPMHHSSSNQMKYIELYNASAKRANIGELHVSVKRSDGTTARVALSGCLDTKRYMVIYPQGEKLEALDIDALSVASPEITGALDSAGAYQLELVNTRSNVAVHKVQLPDMNAKKGISAARPASPTSGDNGEVFVEHNTIKADDGNSENPYSPGLSNSTGVPFG
ncbi:MAG: hypothetical protein IKY83_02525 [Proteobacteria bacterium]|nr:hypothetical protein [Pseudomonadota bacterium]